MGGLQFAGYIIPILLILVFIEFMVSKWKGLETFTFSDTIVNMCCGMLERLFDFFFVVFLYFVFEFLYENVALWQIPTNPFTWIALLFLADFLAYWHHRLSHEINFMWAAHIVHHQSEELNMTTVFRVSAFAVINRAFFWIWMPILGFSPGATTSVLVFIGLYQFVTHTRLVGKLGIFEYLFVTPSSHRVHHARNERYIDKNYGHVFIIWDKMMGTFEEESEEEEPDFGITTGFESSNPYWAYFFYWADLFKRSRGLDSFKDKVKLFLKPPAWMPEGHETPPVTFEVDEKGKRKKYRLFVPIRLRFYLLLNVLITVGAFVTMLVAKGALSGFETGVLTFLVVYSILAHGLLIERRKWALIFEYVRIGVVLISIPVLALSQPYGGILVAGGVILHLILAFWLIRMRDYFGVKEDESLGQTASKVRAHA